MPLFNYGKPFGQAPGYTPGGRGVSYTKDESKAADILSGANSNPNAYSQAQIAWANSVLGPSPAPIVNNARLASPAGVENPLDAFAFGIQRFGRMPQASAINAFNNKYGTSYTAPQLFDYSQKFSGTPGTEGGAAWNSNVLNTQANLANAAVPSATAPLSFSGNFGNIFNGGGNTAGVGVPGTPAPMLPSNNAINAGINASMNTQYNDQNDPGGFIRKWQQKLQASAPLTRTYSGA